MRKVNKVVELLSDTISGSINEVSMTDNRSSIEKKLKSKLAKSNLSHIDVEVDSYSSNELVVTLINTITKNRKSVRLSFDKLETTSKSYKYKVKVTSMNGLTVQNDGSVLDNSGNVVGHVYFDKSSTYNKNDYSQDPKSVNDFIDFNLNKLMNIANTI